MSFVVDLLNETLSRLAIVSVQIITDSFPFKDDCKYNYLIKCYMMTDCFAFFQCMDIVKKICVKKDPKRPTQFHVASNDKNQRFNLKCNTLL